MNLPIVLLGYMGCGKTKIGKSLSKNLNLKFVDLDHEIESIYSKNITHLFENFGEVRFREIERELLIKLLNKNDAFVLSLGGGTPCYFDNMEIIQKKTNFSFYINLSSKVLAKRLFSRKSARPLISSVVNEKDMLSFINKHLFERNIFYMQAKHIINCNKRDINKICKSIIEVLEKNSFLFFIIIQ